VLLWESKNTTEQRPEQREILANPTRVFVSDIDLDGSPAYCSSGPLSAGHESIIAKVVIKLK
jgi:hypothetical protein